MAEILIAIGLLAVGGALGGMARFFVSGVVARRLGETFPWGTMAVNVTGALAIGVLAALFLTPEARAVTNLPAWAGLVLGFLGSYTTVSSFSLQTLALARNGEAGRALANVALSLGLCLAAAAGAWLLTGHLLARAGGA